MLNMSKTIISKEKNMSSKIRTGVHRSRQSLLQSDVGGIMEY
jgi:hypothetical protein